MTDRSLLLNAFQPSMELEDPERFAGRTLQIRRLTDALQEDGTAPIIYGDRGLGKSSLALQIRNIAMGGVDLLHHIGAERLALPEDHHYIAFFVTCTDSTRTLTDLLQLMVNSAESVDLTGAPTGLSLVDRTTSKRIGPKSLQYERTNTYQVESARLPYQDLNLEEKLVDLCDLLSRTFDRPVLFVIDELDRMSSTEGLASFLKAASTKSLKFILVGIAGSISDLLSDHRSLERKLMPVQVPPMDASELADIARKAQGYLNENGISMGFSVQALAHLARVAAGFPWFVHVIGQQALIEADENHRGTISSAAVERAALRISESRFAQQFSDTYQTAVRDSYRREATLRAFAEWVHQDIPTGEIYSILAKLDIRNGATYRGQLLTPEYGSVLMTTKLQKRGLVRFRNEMFKTYIRLRPSIYEGIDSRIRQAFQDR